MEIRRLRASDDRSRFRSGDPDLDRFFRSYAGQNQFRHHVGVTYVAVEDGDVLGYLTVAPGGIEIDDLPVALQRGLPATRFPCCGWPASRSTPGSGGEGWASSSFGSPSAWRSR